MRHVISGRVTGGDEAVADEAWYGLSAVSNAVAGHRREFHVAVVVQVAVILGEVGEEVGGRAGREYHVDLAYRGAGGVCGGGRPVPAAGDAAVGVGGLVDSGDKNPLGIDLDLSPGLSAERGAARWADRVTSTRVVEGRYSRRRDGGRQGDAGRHGESRDGCVGFDEVEGDRDDRVAALVGQAEVGDGVQLSHVRACAGDGGGAGVGHRRITEGDGASEQAGEVGRRLQDVKLRVDVGVGV